MVERERFGKTKRFLTRKAPAIVAAPLLAGCGGSVADLDKPNQMHREPVLVGCDVGQEGMTSTREISYASNNGNNFLLVIVEAGKGYIGNPDPGTEITVLSNEHRLSLGKRSAPQNTTELLSVTKPTVVVTITAESGAVSVEGKCR